MIANDKDSSIKAGKEFLGTKCFTITILIISIKAQAQQKPLSKQVTQAVMYIWKDSFADMVIAASQEMNK